MHSICMMQFLGSFPKSLMVLVKRRFQIPNTNLLGFATNGQIYTQKNQRFITTWVNSILFQRSNKICFGKEKKTGRRDRITTNSAWLLYSGPLRIMGAG